ncbi:hypothetical protein HYV81_05610 [Candidatus Woesearchaeota archaeon]|nr:hypothetical protein [Candidatus Woesearchaeota archaeon]
MGFTVNESVDLLRQSGWVVDGSIDTLLFFRRSSQNSLLEAQAVIINTKSSPAYITSACISGPQGKIFETCYWSHFSFQVMQDFARRVSSRVDACMDGETNISELFAVYVAYQRTS